jgi:pyruvate/2-oxoglutarate dehydrogenase complex dihydrolipoamide acyltransferase (E2) component
MATPVKMPRLGESVAEGTVGAWLKQEGDYVEKDESLAEIITDKINAELPSPVAGRLSKILVDADETVAVGVNIALIEESSDIASTPPPQAAPGPDAAPVKSPSQSATPVLKESPVSVATSEPNGRQEQTLHTDEEERQRISPLARRMRLGVTSSSSLPTTVSDEAGSCVGAIGAATGTVVCAAGVASRADAACRCSI